MKFKGQLMCQELVLRRWREFVFLHLMEHGMLHVGPELAYCWCSVARQYRRTFHMPEPAPNWYPPDDTENFH